MKATAVVETRNRVVQYKRTSYSRREFTGVISNSTVGRLGSPDSEGRKNIRYKSEVLNGAASLEVRRGRE